MSMEQICGSVLASAGFSPDDRALARFSTYAALLVEWNEKINLTAITDEEGIAVKHFLDSALLLKALELPQNAAIIDVGAGAGFPSLPCTILRPDLHPTLLDGLGKRITFLEELTRTLELPAHCVHGRAEELGRTPAYREQFDLATARAVAKLTELAEYCLPLVKVGGAFAALKGYEIEEELAEAKGAIHTLGGKIEEVKKFELPDGSRRSIVIVRKISQTPTKYPRPSGKIRKNPL